MIPGNIDLTENLDFRQLKKSKSVNLVPWKGGDSKLTEKINISFSLDTVSQYYVYSNYNITTTSTHNGWEFRTNYLSSMYIVDDMQLSMTNNSYYDNDLTWNTEAQNTYSISISNDNSTTISIYSCHNKVENRMPWKRSDDFSCDYVSKIPWNRNRKNSFRKIFPWDIKKSDYYLTYDKLIPWIIEDETTLSDHLNQKRNHNKSIIDKIPWLQKLNVYQLSAYLDELNDVDQSSYLTDLRYLRITDADTESLFV